MSDRCSLALAPVWSQPAPLFYSLRGVPTVGKSQ